jgi:hypothetical protein
VVAVVVKRSHVVPASNFLFEFLFVSSTLVTFLMFHTLAKFFVQNIVDVPRTVPIAKELVSKFKPTNLLLDLSSKFR